MGKGLNTATKVLQTTSEMLKSQLVEDTPRWFRPVAFHPPVQNLTKVLRKDFLAQKKATQINSIQSNGLYTTRLKPKSFKSGLLKIDESIQYLEDDIRELFFKQHPWELANPKIMNENENNIDIASLNWESVLQLNKQLDGESVVQRTMYLLKNDSEGKYETVLDAYEQAKYEFYELRMREEVEVQVMKEESEMFGGIVQAGSALNKSYDMETTIIRNWRAKATKETELKNAGIQESNTSIPGVEEEQTK